jgi:hypothetical protein
VDCTKAYKLSGVRYLEIVPSLSNLNKVDNFNERMTSGTYLSSYRDTSLSADAGGSVPGAGHLQGSLSVSQHREKEFSGICMKCRIEVWNKCMVNK